MTENAQQVLPQELLEFLADKKLLLFDVDGTMAETEPLHWEAYNVLLAEQGIHLSDEDVLRYMGNPEIRIYDMIRADHGAAIDDQEFLRQRLAIYLRLVEERDLRPFDYLIPLLNCERDVPKALVTSQRPEIVDAMLERWGIAGFFPKECRISCSSGTPSKGDVYAEPYRYVFGPMACDGSGMADYADAAQVVVFEDADHAIAKARAAGLSTVGIRGALNRERDLGPVVIDAC